VEKLYWNGEWLYKEYVEEGKSVNRIAGEQGVAWRTIQRHLIKNDIPLQKQDSEKKLYWDGEWLYKEYIEEEKSIYQIAREQKVGPTTIRRHLIKNDIPIRESNHGKKTIPGP